MLKDLPTISYNGVFGVSDITTPINVPSNVEIVQTTQGERTRADVVADRIYGDDRLDYMIWLANDTIDPVTFPVLSQSQFDQLIIKQFGSVENAQNTIVYWQNNWKNDQSNITPAAYNSLPKEIRQLYDIQKNYRGDVSGYTRKPINLRKSTSQIVTIVTPNSNLKANSFVSFFTGVTRIGSGRVKVVTSSSVIVEDIVGNSQGTTVTDGTNSSPINSSTVFNVILPTEVPYYSPVTAYDLLLEQTTTQRRSVCVFPQSDLESIKQNLI
jgi:hypothetical protein